MPYLIRIENSKSAVLFESAVPYAETRGPPAHGMANDVVINTFGESVNIGATITGVIDSVVGAVAELKQKPGPANGPNEVEIAFGIQVSPEGNVFVGQSGQEANLSIRFSWSRT